MHNGIHQWTLLFCCVLAAAGEGILGNRRIRSHHSWFAKYGLPASRSVAAFCNLQGVTIAVPVPQFNSNLSLTAENFSVAWGSPLSKIQVQAGRSRGTPCASRYERGFFEEDDAWLAKASHGDCAGHEIRTGDLVIYTNRWSVHPDSSRNVLVTCACVLDSGNCTANARWEEDVLMRASSSKGDEVMVGGYSLTTAAMVGENRDVDILPDHESRFHFESYGPPQEYLVPWTCSAHFFGQHEQKLLVGGCPVSPKLDFKLHYPKLTLADSSVEIEQIKGHIAFSFRIVGMEVMSPAADVTILCEMATTEKPTTFDALCNEQQLLQPRDLMATPSSVFAALDHEDEEQGSSLPPIGFRRLRWQGRQQRAPNRQLISREEAEAQITQKFKSIEHLIQVPSLNDDPADDMVEDASEPVSRYRSPVISSVSNDLSVDNWGVSWSRGRPNRETAVKIGNEKGWIGGDIGLEHRRASASVGWRDFNVNALANLDAQEVGAAAKYGKYGVAAYRNNMEDGTAIDVTTPLVNVGSLANFLDRNYGQKIRVKDFEIMVRHDFDEHMKQDPNKLASEFLMAYKDVGVAVGSDVTDARYGVSVGIKGYQVSILKDFDERQTDFVGNFGDGWQVYVSQNLPDQYSNTIRGRVGIGNLKQAYVMATAGVGNDGMPEFSAQYQGKKVGVLLDFEGSDPAGDKTLVTGVSFGKFTYIWRSRLALENLDIPLLVGVQPSDVRTILTPG